MTIRLNGEEREVPDGLTVGALVEHLGLVAGRLAIEHNLVILPRGRWKDAAISPGDQIEIVHMVGGG